MKFISHRGNIRGKKESEENKPITILNAVNLGYDCEIDLWLIHDELFLGHDMPEYLISADFLISLKSSLWVHCKNVEAMIWCNNLPDGELNYFWHETDKVVLTSKGNLWAYPGNQPISNSVAVMPELFQEKKLSECLGICSDNIELYKKEYEKV